MSSMGLTSKPCVNYIAIMCTINLCCNFVVAGYLQTKVLLQHLLFRWESLFWYDMCFVEC